MRELIRALSPEGWARLLIGAALLILVLFVVGRCSRGDEVREERGKTAAAEGRTVSAVEAITEIESLGDRGEATDRQVQEAHDAIRQADPAVRDRVARAELCRLQRGQNDSSCDRLLGAGADCAGGAHAAR